MGKAARIKRYRQRAVLSGRSDQRSVARALRRHGRFPLAVKEPIPITRATGARASRFVPIGERRNRDLSPFK